jgi:hypothetical protein
MIDPRDVTKYNRTTAELEEFLLFAIVVAGKTAMRQAQCLEVFLQSLPGTGNPFEKIEAIMNISPHHSCPHLIHYLQGSKLGQYTRIEKAFRDVVCNLQGKLDTCTISDLESLHGIGAKTARFFILHTRKSQRIAVLDTHALKHLRNNNVVAPKGTPGSGPEYQRLEAEFLKLYDASGYTNLADFDLMIWRLYSGN